METQAVYIITGLSGSGKTTAVQAFEDASFYCIDNMPMELVPKFLELPLEKNPKIQGTAFVMDMRSKNFIEDFAAGINTLQDQGVVPQIIFLEARVDTLVKRYSQTRRHHPVSHESSLLESINSERKTMQPVKQAAHHILDTSTFTVHELKSAIFNLIHGGKGTANPMKLNILSFGFKYGVPLESNLVMDLRFLVNPYFVPELKNQDGESEAVKDFVLSNPETESFLEKYFNLIDYLIPLYKKENKAYLTIAVGCTGGRHRSVAVARTVYEHLNKKGLNPGIIHRDIDRDVKEL